MENYLLQTLRGMPQLFLVALGLFVLFSLLERWTPCNPRQPLLDKHTLTDALYYFLVPVFTKLIFLIYIRMGIALFFAHDSDDVIADHIMHGFGPLGALPLWAQAAIAFILSDVILYWTHRLFHGKTFWRFHTIHHCPTQVSWHSTYRFHPINIWLTFTLVNTLMIFMGLSMESMAMLATFNTLYSAMVHANLNWTFGPFKYCFASPVFHRWHHTSQEEGMNKNFAPTFPLLDVVFGTYYMPEGKVPEHYGITGSQLPESFWEQLVWPFKN